MSLFRVGCALAAVLAVSACSESHAPMPGPIEGRRREVDLTDAEYLELCEWWEAHWGWPVAELTCLDGSAYGGRLVGPEGCLAFRLYEEQIPDCELRVEDWYECAAAMSDWCTRSPECHRPEECRIAGRGPYIGAAVHSREPWDP